MCEQQTQIIKKARPCRASVEKCLEENGKQRTLRQRTGDAISGMGEQDYTKRPQKRSQRKANAT